MKLTNCTKTLASGSCALALLGTATAGDPDAFQPLDQNYRFAVEEGESEGNGTDPRDFAPKFMPYLRYTQLDNDLESFEATAFGLVPIPIGNLFGQPDYKWAFTFEFPAFKYVDASDPISKFKDSVPIEPGVEVPTDLIDDDDVGGTGDLNMRLLIPFWQGQIGGIGMAALTGFELWFPTASDDLLGTGRWQIAPHLTVVADLAKDKGIFLASMNFYRTSFGAADGRDGIELYIGRHFLNVPFGQSGYYMLPELQTIYDLDDSDWEIWFGPEFGKILKPGRILYLKPGIGIDPDPDERDFSVELGYRHFF